MITFDQLTQESLNHRETADCTVKALAVVREIPYHEAHAICKQFGRKPRAGMSQRKINIMLKAEDNAEPLPHHELDRLRQLLRIGIQWNTQVTLNAAEHTVSQAYCSALPVAYSHLSPDLWASFARLILEGAYEATFCAAVLNARRNGSSTIFLTLLGGGAFGNQTAWIIDAIRRSLALYKDRDLDVVFVSYGMSNPHIHEIINEAHGW